MYHYSELKGNIIYRIDVGCKWDAELIWNNEFKTIKSPYMYVNTISNSYIELFIYLSDKLGVMGYRISQIVTWNKLKVLYNVTQKTILKAKTSTCWQFTTRSSRIINEKSSGSNVHYQYDNNKTMRKKCRSKKKILNSHQVVPKCSNTWALYNFR